MFEGSQIIQELLPVIVGFLIAIGVHEYAHARVAYALGDSTAADMGRMTLNPFKHLSLWGTLFLVFFRFGWSEPVPVDPRNFRFPRRDSLLTAFAGPAANFLTAAAFGLLTQLLPASTRLPELTVVIVLVNFILAFFNLIPVPPLDGSSVLPYLFQRQPLVLLTLQRQGFLLLFGLILLDVLSGGHILGTLVGQPARALTRIFLGGVGF